MKRLLQRAYNMLQLRLQAMLCTVCLHTHDIMQDPFICFWVISQMVYGGYVLHKGRSLFFIVVLHNSAHYASDATLNERKEILSRVSYRIGHSSACRRYQRAASSAV